MLDIEVRFRATKLGQALRDHMSVRIPFIGRIPEISGVPRRFVEGESHSETEDR